MSEGVLIHNRTAGRKTLHYKKLLLPAWFCSRAGLRGRGNLGFAAARAGETPTKEGGSIALFLNGGIGQNPCRLPIFFGTKMAFRQSLALSFRFSYNEVFFKFLRVRI